MAGAETATPSTMQKMAAEIFSDMVMEEAIKDKTIQVKEQLKDQEGQLHDLSMKSDLLHDHRHEDDEDDDEFGDAEEEKIMRDFRERRMQQMKNVY